jgi:hypothetical protein
MPDSFLLLSDDDRKEVLQVAASRTGRLANLLEKDVWVVKALDILFSSQFGSHLVFKGGTALSKVHKIIDRFSEDVDVTYDIRQLAPDTGQFMQSLDVIPPNRSQQKNLTDSIRKELLPVWLQSEIRPLFHRELSGIPGVGLMLLSSPNSPGPDTLVIEYPAVTSPSSYAPPTIKLEFGGRSTGEPATTANVGCDIADLFPDLKFPRADPRTMNVSRIFWEKATAAHIYCVQHKQPIAHRFSRHFHDLAKLNVSGLAFQAIANRQVASSVAEHKNMFFREKTEDGEVIEYSHAVSGGLMLVPAGEALEALRRDYQLMLSEGLLRADELDFNSIIAHCQTIQELANSGR